MSALITNGGATATMTSQEIADLVEKRHDNVKRTIEMLAARGAIESPQSEEIPTANRCELHETEAEFTADVEALKRFRVSIGLPARRGDQ
ncbi:hypothetical protein [Ottowia thiooxydans]|uniref:hypothetical protein n=1 Tax=Ottowia thiooxydans TaxID=219182 RepID=UPI0003F72D30|nr:hypothetical protein [Ottowia thiooxydans]